MRVEQTFMRWGMPVVLGVALALAIASPKQPVADAHLEAFGHTSMYSYGENNCVGAVDPISVIVYAGTSSEQMQTHLAHHG